MALNWLMMIVFLLLPNQLHSQSDTTIFNYTTFSNDGDLIYQGDARVPTGLTSIYLTAVDDRTNPVTPMRYRVGRVLYSPPIRLWDGAGRRQANFQTIIRGFIGNNDRSPAMGDGISFFIAPVNTTIPDGSREGNLGLYGSSGSSPTPLFAVELDVFPNSWDPNYGHLGININSRNSIKVARWEILDPGRNVEARITYDARARLITANAYANPSYSGGRPVTARLEHALDLKTLLPEWVQIGISASTGMYQAAVHDIRGWSFISFMVPDSLTNIDHNNSTDDVVQNTNIPQYV